jgi:hypothetical protein
MLDPGNLEARNALQFIASQTNMPFEAYVISLLILIVLSWECIGDLMQLSRTSPHEGQKKFQTWKKILSVQKSDRNFIF